MHLMTRRRHNEDPILRARNEIANRVLMGLPVDRAALVAIGARFEVDAFALAAGMVLRHAFGSHCRIDA